MQTTTDLRQALPQIAAQTLQDHKDFVGLSLFPLYPTSIVTGGYWKLADDWVLDVPTSVKRAPGAPSSRSVAKLADDTYNAEIYTHEEPVPVEADAKYGRPGAAVKAATRRAETILLLNHELRAYAMATDASVPSAEVTVPWNDPSSNPALDIQAARAAVFTGCGLEANVVTLPRTVFESIKRLPAIKEVIKLNSKDSRWPEMLAALFDVEQVLVARALINQAHEGQALNVGEIWGGSVMVARVDRLVDPLLLNQSEGEAEEFPDLQAPSFGRTFIVTDDSKPLAVAVDVYDSPRDKSTIVRAQQQTAEKITGLKCGFHLKKTLGA